MDTVGAAACLDAQIVLGFYRENPDDDRLEVKDRRCGGLWTWLARSKSRVIAWWIRVGAHQYSHVELMFPDDSVVSTTERTGLHFNYDRVLTNSNYEKFLSIQVTTAGVIRMKEWLAGKEGLPFNWEGKIWNNVSALRTLAVVDTGEDSYFCSELIVTLLQIGGACVDIDARCTNPTQLYVWLLRSGEGRPHYNVKKTGLKRANQTPTSDTPSWLLGDLV